MPDSELLPEQEELLRLLIEAYNRLKPQRVPFDYSRDMTQSADVAILRHRGWLPDSPAVYIGDLSALAEARFIRVTPMGRWFRFELTAPAFAHYELLAHPGDENYKTRLPLKVRLDDGGRVQVICGEKRASLPPAQGKHFLRLLVALKQGSGGWVSHDELYLGDLDLVSNGGASQANSRLRASLAKIIDSVNSKDLIEASGAESTRVSVPPRLVECDVASLIKSEDATVRRLAEGILQNS